MERATYHRLRWRMRGAWMWPAFVVLTAVDAVLLHELPVAGEGTAPVAGLLLSGFLNLLVVAVAAPLAGRLVVRRRRPDLPAVVATDYAGAALVVAVAVVLALGGLLHRPAVQRVQHDLRDQAAAARRYLLTSAPSRARAHLDAATTLQLSDRFYRTCVPDGRPGRAFCVFVRTAQDPPVVRPDPDRTPNAAYRQFGP